MLNVDYVEDRSKEVERKKEGSKRQMEQQKVYHCKQVKIIQEIIKEIISKSITHYPEECEWVTIDGEGYISWKVYDMCFYGEVICIFLLSDGRLAILNSGKIKILNFDLWSWQYLDIRDIKIHLLDIAKSDFRVNVKGYWLPLTLLHLQRKKLLKLFFG